ncbi:MAG: RHS repeat-associated core domain-containing protein [Candidatus Nitrotoga sp.]
MTYSSITGTIKIPNITGTTKTWRYADHLGSVIAEADAMGNATAIRGYGPFGENGTTAPNRFGYTGQQYIAGLGLYYYKARWYSPTMGRFLETDPIGYGDGVNWYAYVGNGPVNRRDPTGLYWFQQDWQAAYPIVGRFDSLIEPGGPVSSFIEQYVPAGRTLAEIHDPLVDTLRNAGVPDWLANIPTMLPTYAAGIGTEVLRTLGIVDQPTPLPAQPMQPTPSK